MRKQTEVKIARFDTKLCVWSVLCLAVITAGCAAPQNASSVHINKPAISQSDSEFPEFDELEEEFAAQETTIGDPIEPWNRLMFNANDSLYFWILKPAAQGYSMIVPEPGRIGIRNFFQNLTTPVRMVNCLLQGKFHSAGNEINRFVINTTWGILGFWDFALEHGKIEPANEDLGQTLAIYGLGDGFYIVWPILGPSTLRDSAGKGGDFFLYPVYYIKPDEPIWVISAVDFTNKTSLQLGEYEAFKAAAVDPYIAMRNAYIQYRNKQIQE